MKYIVLRGEPSIIFNFFPRLMSNIVVLIPFQKKKKIVVLIFLLCTIRTKRKLEKIKFSNKDLSYFNRKGAEEEMGETVFLENYILMLLSPITSFVKEVTTLINV